MSSQDGPVRIAMWSGPRNISTALMRAWENRPDTAVCDEPFYACYLKRTGLVHPGRNEIIQSQPTEWFTVIENLTGVVPERKSIFYQKHMVHHLLPEIDRTWLPRLKHAFLIRSPREMLPSLARVTPDPTVRDTGLPQQLELYSFLLARTGEKPPVVDSRDVLENPEGMLRALCRALKVPFLESMLSWPPGPRASDGVWAPYWYDRVGSSSGFRPYRPKREEVPPALEDVCGECQQLYARLHRNRLEPHL